MALLENEVLMKCLVVLAVVGAGQTELRCFNCQTELAYPRACPFVRKCNLGEVCYVDEIHTPDGHVYFKTGCRLNTTCGTGISGTANEHRTCEECCNTDFCNSGGCQQPSLPSPDQRGPLCYDCADMQSADECNRVTVCGLDYDCWIHESLGGFQYRYSTGCQRKSFCHALESLQFGRRQLENEDLVRAEKTATTHSYCSVCCAGDLCNRNCSLPVHAP